MNVTHIGGNIMKINDLLESAGVKVTCGCSEDTCSHCAGKHTLDEVGQKCSCCGNEIKEVKVNETATAGATAAGNIASVANPTAARAKIKKDKNGIPKANQRTNPDGTAKNALDVNDNLMGGSPARR